MGVKADDTVVHTDGHLPLPLPELLEPLPELLEPLEPSFAETATTPARRRAEIRIMKA